MTSPTSVVRHDAILETVTVSKKIQTQTFFCQLFHYYFIFIFINYCMSTTCKFMKMVEVTILVGLHFFYVRRLIQIYIFYIFFAASCYATFPPTHWDVRSWTFLAHTPLLQYISAVVNSVLKCECCNLQLY